MKKCCEKWKHRSIINVIDTTSNESGHLSLTTPFIPPFLVNVFLTM